QPDRRRWCDRARGGGDPVRVQGARGRLRPAPCRGDRSGKGLCGQAGRTPCHTGPGSRQEAGELIMATNDTIARVRYFDGQFLRAVDFEAEQAYDRDARRRHLLAHHTWGIVVGLELVEAPIAGQTDYVDVILNPGAAVDAYGRELVSYHTIRLDPSAFAGFNVDGYQDVWLMYQEDQAGALSSNWEDCQQSQSTRTTEGWTIVVAP